GLNRIVDLLTQSHRSVTAVGDDDQCIYSFRGASAFNLSDFRGRYGDHPQFAEVVLDRNYRSTQPILDLANEVMLSSPGRQEKMLHAVTPDRSASKPVVWVGSSDAQATFAAAEIARLHKAGYGYDDFAILTRTHKYGREMMQALKKEQIPIIHSRAAFFELPAIRQTLAWCHIVAQSPAAAVGLYRLLYGQAERPDASDFRKAWAYLSSPDRDKNPPANFDDLPEATIRRLQQLIALTDAADDVGLTKTIWRIMEINGLFRQHAQAGFYEDELATRNLSQFIQLAARFDKRYGRPDLTRFLRYIDVLQGTGAVDASLPMVELPNGGVHVMTVHGAKGREFPVVILPFLQSARFPQNFRPPKVVETPPDAWLSWQLTDRLSPKEEHVEEERRLFYVGMTRAREHLILTTTPKRRSKFIVNLKEGIMDEKSMREWLTQVSDELASMERYRQLLLTLLRTGQEWLSLNADSGRQLHFGPPADDASTPHIPSNPEQRLHLSQALVAPILHEAAGARLHTKEVWFRAMGIGAWSRAKDPVATTDSILLALSRKVDMEIERLGDRFYRSTKFDEPSRATAHEYEPVAMAP
ncbi:MAG: ATP-dependent helicase, partial [Candidatus Marinimicrobia bacterium]|nr:ATP-dependent helicase [Candidatus Neomarinimicrobiota bacterium]